MSTAIRNQAQESSQTKRYSEMNATSFSDETGKVFEALEEVRQLVSKHVRDGNIQPIDAWRGLSAFTANVLGYEEAVPRNVSGSMLQALNENLSGIGSQR